MHAVNDTRRCKRNDVVSIIISSSAVDRVALNHKIKRKYICRNIPTRILFLTLGMAASIFILLGVVATTMLNNVHTNHVPESTERHHNIPTHRFDDYYHIHKTNSSSTRGGNTQRIVSVVNEDKKRDKKMIDDDHVQVQQPENAALPTYTNKLATDAIRPAPWLCGNGNVDDSLSASDNERHVFSFVHVYKSAGSTIRTFFRQYAHTCHKSWMLLVSCKESRSPSTTSSLVSIRNLGDERGQEEYWKGCRIKEVIMRPTNNDQIHNKSMLPSDSIDIYGGHFRIGTIDDDNNNVTALYFPARKHLPTRILQQPVVAVASPTVVLRHIVFLRDPMSRFVSGILYQHQRSSVLFDGTLDGAVQRVKKNVLGSVKKHEYWLKSLKYLLTPSQARYFSDIRKESMVVTNDTITLKETMDSIADIESRTAIQNLVQFNVIVGMVERMDQSMTILHRVLVPPIIHDNATDASYHEQRKTADALFISFGGRLSSSDASDASSKEEKAITNVEEEEEEEEEERDELSENDVRVNESGQEGVTTVLVLDELKKDASFLPVFSEYVKYEQRIHDYALKMHEMQYQEVVKA